MAERVKIGTATLTEAVDRKLSYETAAWSKTVHCEPQTVDVTAELKDGQVVDTSLGWALVGTVTDAHFPSLLGGVAVTSGARPEEIGKEETVHVSPYAHAVARELLAGETSAVTLALDVEPLYTPFRDHAGTGRYTSGLYREPSEEQRQMSRGVAAALAGQPIPSDSPAATFGWSLATESRARELAEQAQRLEDMAGYALRQYAPDYVQRPELDSVEL